MNKLELQDAIDIIKEAAAVGGNYPEQAGNNEVAKAHLILLYMAIGRAKEYAEVIINKAESWAEAEKAARYPHPTAREKFEHYE